MNKISIIIPVYNGEKTLKTCLLSLQKQTVKDWLALLIDDGSEDKSYSLMNEFAQKDKRFLLAKSQHRGVSAARNYLLKKVETPFFTFLDCDDYWQENYLEEMLKMAEIDLVFCDYLNRYPNNTYKRQYHFKERAYFNKDDINFLKEATICNYPYLDLAGPVCKRYKTSILKEGNIHFEEDCLIYEDYLFNLDYLNYCNNAYYLREGLYIRQIIDSSLLHRFHPNAFKESLLALKKAEKRLINNPCAYEQFVTITFLKLLALHTFHPQNKLTQKEAIKIFYWHCNSTLLPYWQIFKQSKNLSFRQKIKRFLITKHLLTILSHLRKRG